MITQKKPQPIQKSPPEPSVRDTFHAFQDVLFSLKRRRVNSQTSIDLAAALGADEPLLQHLKNLSVAVKTLEKAPRSQVKTLPAAPGAGKLKSVMDGTSPFRVKHRLLEPALAGRSTTVNMEQLEEAVLVLHAYNRLETGQ
jgi:hypothetical protein